MSVFNSYDTFLWLIVVNTKAFCPQGFERLYRAGIDAIILVIWIIHEEVHNRIKDYW
jgi:hypothetical protein